MDKKELVIKDRSASKSLTSLSTLLLVLAIICLVVGVFIIFIGAADTDSEVIATGFVCMLCSIPLFIRRVTLNALQSITECSEYIKAYVERENDVKYIINND